MDSKINNIKIQFLKGIPLNKIHFEHIFAEITWDDQQNFLNQTILNGINQKYPLRKSYQIAFLKHVIKELERYNEEVYDGFYENLTSLLEAEEEEFSYKHFQVPGSASFITLKESNSFIRDGTTGLKLWPAAIRLSEFIVANKDYFRDKSILELGSGSTGYVGMVLKAIGAKKIFLSDCHEVVLRNLIENVTLNLEHASEASDASLLVRHRIKIQNSVDFGILALPWEEIDEHTEELHTIISPDIILAADVIYDDTIFESLIHCLNALFSGNNGNNSLEFFLSQTIRNEDTFHKFCELLTKNSFSAEEMLLDNDNEGVPRDTHSMEEEIRILKITKL